MNRRKRMKGMFEKETLSVFSLPEREGKGAREVGGGGISYPRRIHFCI